MNMDLDMAMRLCASLNIVGILALTILYVFSMIYLFASLKRSTLVITIGIFIVMSVMTLLCDQFVTPFVLPGLYQ